MRFFWPQLTSRSLLAGRCSPQNSDPFSTFLGKGSPNPKIIFPWLLGIYLGAGQRSFAWDPWENNVEKVTQGHLGARHFEPKWRPLPIEFRNSDLSHCLGFGQFAAPPHLTSLEVGVRAMDQESRIKNGLWVDQQSVGRCCLRLPILWISSRETKPHHPFWEVP